VIRYAQCWEDADVLLEALDPQPAHVCVSVASAGDNTLALLAKSPASVLAIDLNPAQLACLELRVAAFRELEHPQVLELLGSVPSSRRESLYARCRSQLSPRARWFWDARSADIAGGLGSAGKLERYLADFARYVLPLLHSSPTVAALLEQRTAEQRAQFYARRWNTWRWRLAFRVFFSRWLMARHGRERSFFTYAHGNVAGHLLRRTRHALTALDPAANPYLQWILFGRHVTALPYALRPENFNAIRRNLDRLEWRCLSLQELLVLGSKDAVDRFNLSDVFEYVAPDTYERLLEQIAACARPGARLAYWNLLARRRSPQRLRDRLRPLVELSGRLHQQDKAFFYSDFVVEEVL
jgi:S-adenosylmethionine-diacylglycerol 3-amino-3-carboxypropyl transferase